jgi:hypothetical protein
MSHVIRDLRRWLLDVKPIFRVVRLRKKVVRPEMHLILKVVDEVEWFELSYLTLAWVIGGQAGGWYELIWTRSAVSILPDLFEIYCNWSAMFHFTGVEAVERCEEVVVLLKVNKLDVYPLLVEVMKTPVVIVGDDHIERVCEVGWRFCKYASD